MRAKFADRKTFTTSFKQIALKSVEKIMHAKIVRQNIINILVQIWRKEEVCLDCLQTTIIGKKHLT